MSKVSFGSLGQVDVFKAQSLTVVCQRDSTNLTHPYKVKSVPPMWKINKTKQCIIRYKKIRVAMIFATQIKFPTESMRRRIIIIQF